MSTRSDGLGEDAPSRTIRRRGRALAEPFVPSLGANERIAKLLLLGLVIAGWFILAALLHDPLYDAVAVVSSTLMLVGAVAFFLMKPHPGRDAYRFLGFFVFSQAFMANGVNVLQAVESSLLSFAPTQPAFSFAMSSSLVFSASFMLGAMVFGANISPIKAPDEHHPALNNTVLTALAFGSTAVALIFALTGVQPDSGIGRLGTLPLVLLNPLLVVPFVTASHLLEKKRVLPLAILLIGHAGLTLMNSSIGAVAGVIRDLLLTHVFLHRRLPRWVLISTIAVVFILNPAKHIFRRQMAEDKGTSAQTVEQAIGMWTDALAETWVEKQESEDRSAAYRETTRRLDYNWVAAQIYTMVPAALPFEEGDTYGDIPLMLVPRLLMPDKPTSNGYTRSRWSVKLGMQTWSGATKTAVAIPPSGEAYWNFGWAGVFAVPFALGIVVGAMLHLSPKDQIGRAAYVLIAASSLCTFLDMLVWVVPSFVSVAIAAALLRVFSWLGRKSFNEKPRGPAQALDR